MHNTEERRDVSLKKEEALVELMLKKE